MIRRASLISALGVSMVASLAAQTSRPAGNAVSPAQIDAIFAEWNRPDSPGCALAIMQNGQVVYERGYGMANLSHDVKIEAGTLFDAASLSKQFTAAAIVLLAGQGKLSLDDRIHRYLPELPDFGAPVTIRQLLHHTSGLRDQLDLLMLSEFRPAVDLITDADVMSLVARQKALNFPPGSQFSYTNTGYTLLAQIVERVSGRSLREFTTHQIFTPLGMKRTHFREDHAEVDKGEALAYVPAPKGAFRLAVTNFDTAGPASLRTTVEDLAKWDENFYAPRIGGPDFTRKMTQLDPLTGGEPGRYAMGLYLDEYRGLPIVEHSGAIGGYRANLIRFPQQRFSAACLCNTLANAAELTRKVADLYLAPRFTKSAPAVSSTGEPMKLPQARVAGKAGFYHTQGLGVLLQLSAEDGLLSLTNKGQRKPLRTDGKGAFQFPSSAYSVRFEPSEGEASRLILDSGGRLPEVWERMPAYSPPRAAQNEFAGVYYSDELDVSYRIEASQGALLLERKKYRADTLQPIARDLFGDAALNSLFVAPIQFLRDSTGRVSLMTLSTDRSRNLKFVRQDDEPQAHVASECDAWFGSRAPRGASQLPSIDVEQLKSAGMSIEPSRRMRAEGYPWEHEIQIALPSSYRTTDRRYPVLWVTDGQFFFKLAAMLVARCAHERFPEMIVVGIGSPPEAESEAQMRRSFDFSPNTIRGFEGFGGKLHRERQEAADKKLKERGEAVHPRLGGGPRFLSFVVHDVRRQLARDYRLADDHTLFGDSGGGLICAYALLAQPATFDRYICGSASLAAGDFEVFRLEQRYAQRHKDLQAKVFFGAGEAEALQGGSVSSWGVLSSTTRIAEILKMRAYPSLKLDFRIFPGENHSSVMPLNLAWGLRAVWQDDSPP